MDLFYQRFGAGHPLIILHGLLGSLTNWSSMGKRFGQSFEVWAVDQRNHGGSPHDPTMNYALMADDLREFMDQHGIRSAHVLGHSMGGKTAMQFALTYPDRVDTLIVVDIAPRGYAPHHDEVFDAMFALDLDAAMSRSDLDRALIERVPYAPTRQFILTNIVRDDDGRFAWKIDLHAIYRNYNALMAPITADHPFDGPTLFVRGEQSDYITDTDRKEIELLFPRAEIVTIAGAGHWVHAEAPGPFIEVVLRFLGS